jgi:hypothetical protein
MHSGRYRILIAALLASLTASADSHQQVDGQQVDGQQVVGKQVVGATELIEIGPLKTSFKARVDSGAKTSSIHAENIVFDLHDDARGKPIAFDLVNKAGHSQRIESEVVRMIKVRTSEGSEMRYAVVLTMTRNNASKTVLVTLNDRNAMQYRLLLGRNWLHGDYIVDVDINNDD